MKPFYLIFLVIFIMLVSSCKKDDPITASNIFNTWEAKLLLSIESKGYPKNEDNQILLVIEESKEYQLQLDVNGCLGTILKITDTEIQFSAAVCTEMGGDSEFSMKLAEMLPQVKSYTIVENNLRLSVPDWGMIIFELKE